MYKILSLIFQLGLTLFALLILSEPVAALDTCPVQTTPDPLYNTNRVAGFTITVPNYPKYKVQFQCGNSGTIDATKTGDREIYVGINREGSIGFPCEFDAGVDKKIKVIAVVNNKDVEHCVANYNVIDAITQCKLDIDPKDGITSATTLNLFGSNLAAPNGRGFSVFFNEDAIDFLNNPAGRLQIDLPGYGDVPLPSFGPKAMPQELMTPGIHAISLRQKKVNTKDLLLNPLLQEKDFFGTPYCPVTFRVGTPENPGSIIRNNIARGIPCTTNCSSAGGFKTDETKECTDNKDHPGIITAIGCIRTNPSEFAQDLLKFLLGISGGIAFLMMLLGAFQMLTSAGNPDTLRAGRERLSSAVIGLLIVIFSVLLLQIIGFDILKIPDFSR